MQYLLLFLEGILTFISPCLLPMIPLYLSYFIGKGNSKSPLKEILQFIVGFSLIFISLTFFTRFIGQYLIVNRQIIQLIVGIVLIIFGIDLLFDQFISRKLFRNNHYSSNNPYTLPPFIFGLLFGITWTPCVGIYLASAISLTFTASHQMEAFLMILTYSLGLALPFLLSALFINEAKLAFKKIYPYMNMLQKFSGILLIVFGILMITGKLYQFMTF